MNYMSVPKYGCDFNKQPQRREDWRFDSFGEKLQELIEIAERYANPLCTDGGTSSEFNEMHWSLCEVKDRYMKLLEPISKR